MTVRVEVSYGELIDKITILEIKQRNVSDPGQRKNVETELRILSEARDAAFLPSNELDRLTDALRDVNGQLWQIEDDIRDCEREQDFGETFIGLARAVYRTNDQRAALKREINDLLGSPLVEEKLYQDY